MGAGAAPQTRVRSEKVESYLERGGARRRESIPDLACPVIVYLSAVGEEWGLQESPAKRKGVRFW